MEETGVDLTQTKHCPRCGEEKTWAEFGLRTRQTKAGPRTYPQQYCKPCQRDAANEWYKNNKHRHITNVKAAQRRKREAAKESTSPVPMETWLTPLVEEQE